MELDDNYYEFKPPVLWKAMTLTEDVVAQISQHNEDPQFSISTGIMSVVFLLATKISDAA